MSLLSTINKGDVREVDRDMVGLELVGTRCQKAEKREQKEDSKDTVYFPNCGPVVSGQSGLTNSIPQPSHEGVVDSALQITLDMTFPHYLTVNDDFRVGVGRGDRDSLCGWRDERTPAQRDQHRQGDQSLHAASLADFYPKDVEQGSKKHQAKDDESAACTPKSKATKCPVVPFDPLVFVHGEETLNFRLHGVKRI